MFRRGIQDVLVRTLGWLPAQLYGLVVRARHRLYDAGILPSQEGALPTLVLGNLTVGGTGKTPLTERLVLDLENILGKGNVQLDICLLKCWITFGKNRDEQECQKKQGR